MCALAMDGYYRARENIGRYSRIFLGILSLVSEKHMLEYSQLLKGKAGRTISSRPPSKFGPYWDAPSGELTRGGGSGVPSRARLFVTCCVKRSQEKKIRKKYQNPKDSPPGRLQWQKKKFSRSSQSLRRGLETERFARSALLACSTRSVWR